MGASGTDNSFSGTAVAAIAEVFFDGGAVGTGGHSPAAEFFLENVDGADSFDFSLDGGANWQTLAPTESVNKTHRVSNARNSFLIRRNAAADADYNGYCVVDFRHAR